LREFGGDDGRQAEPHRPQLLADEQALAVPQAEELSRPDGVVADVEADDGIGPEEVAQAPEDPDGMDVALVARRGRWLSRYHRNGRGREAFEPRRQRLGDVGQRAAQRPGPAQPVGHGGEVGLALVEVPALRAALVDDERTEIVEAEREHHLGVGQDRPRRLHSGGPEDAEDTEALGVGLVDDPLAVEGRDDRRTEALGERFDGRPGPDGPRPDTDDDLAGRSQLVGDQLDGRRGRWLQTEHLELMARGATRVVVRQGHGLDVRRQGEVDGRPVLLGLADRVAEKSGELIGWVHVTLRGVGVPKKRAASTSWKTGPPLPPARHQTGDGEHRGPVEVGVEDACRHVVAAGQAVAAHTANRPLSLAAADAARAAEPSWRMRIQETSGLRSMASMRGMIEAPG
jgi:hypothetical protein